MADIQVEVQGQDAVAATEELFTACGIDGTWEPVEETEREGVLVTIGTVIGIVGGAVAVAEQVRKWYQEYKQGKSGKKIEKVLIVGRDGKRLLLEDASLEDIRRILED